ncbi:unnamed protein product (macronuclear) [Paramecium tetraurelia]|uniref:EB1 C-terminal domain-containing protein n=1 Tax=Paramecium tetraurelia TaxID=5888 RepID=A0BHW5_PARTE|nr:uncharacterized protein GSPATT00029168001 [Paramecium tetraurelia]CAK58132.1 unnamed protein product [Paramecium tetraurelia]|eukprot:XP_001425530.1 hypothetical protein (macronuclear) [Paramecium tetraurelia strain d4-2]
MEQGIEQLGFSNRNRQVGQIVSSGKKKSKSNDEGQKIIRLDKLRQQIVSLEIEAKKPKLKLKKLNSENMLLIEKQQLEDDIKEISQRLEKMKQIKIVSKQQQCDLLQDKQDFEQRWNNIQKEDEIQSFQERMQTLLNEEQEPSNHDIEILTKEVEELLCFKIDDKPIKYDLFTIEEEQQDQSFT